MSGFVVELSERPWLADDGRPGPNITLSPGDLHQRVLNEIGSGSDPATAGRRRIVERHLPDAPVGWWVECRGGHGSEGSEYEWPCDDYLDAAGPAASVFPTKRP